VIIMYASWHLGTSEVTTTTKFGVEGYWAKLPDAFPPIQYIRTTSVAVPADGNTRGCIVTIVETTTGANGYGPVQYHIDARGIIQYQTGDKWFLFRSRPDLRLNQEERPQIVYTQVQLYYRSSPEVGTIGA